MVNLEGLRNKIYNSIFVSLGSDLLYSSLITPEADKYGDETEESYTTERLVLAVPYNLIGNRRDYQDFGDLSIGDVDIAFQHNSTLGIDMRVKWNNKYYFVKEIEEFPIANGNLVSVARLSKSII